MTERTPAQKQKTKKLFKKLAIGLLIVAAAPFAMPAFARFAGSSSGYQDLIMNKLQACPHARNLLGENAGPAIVGLAWGSSETEGGMHGHAQWRVPVSGSRGSGVYNYALELHGGQWQIMTAQLDVGGQLVDIGSCSGGGVAAGGGQPNAQAQGYAVAAGQCFQQGDMACALTNSQAACTAGHPASCGNAAHLLLTQHGDANGAAQLARIACQAGEASGCENLGTALRTLGDTTGAYQALSQSCQMGLDVACALVANMDLERGDLTTATQSANKALQLNPNRSSAHRQLGHVYLFSGYVDQALGYYGRAVQTAAIADQGRDVVEGVKAPPVTLIQQEITALARAFPQRAAEVQQIWPRLPALAGGVPGR